MPCSTSIGCGTSPSVARGDRDVCVLVSDKRGGIAGLDSWLREQILQDRLWDQFGTKLVALLAAVCATPWDAMATLALTEGVKVFEHTLHLSLAAWSAASVPEPTLFAWVQVSVSPLSPQLIT